MPIRIVPLEVQTRIWGEGGFRTFLSHRSAVVQQTTDLKERLASFGISAFVAHRNINPTIEWQNEIENALASMGACVALMTADFHDSDWTDQEVGYAIARGVPIIAVNLARIPYGFIGKFQALQCNWDNAAEKIAGLLLSDGQMFDAYIEVLQKCGSFDHGNVLAKPLPHILSFRAEQIDKLIETFNENGEIQGSFGFYGQKARDYGPGLVFYLNKLGQRKFKLSGTGRIEPA